MVAAAAATTAAVDKQYLPADCSPERLTDPLASPIYLADYDGLVQPAAKGGRLLVITGGCEALAPDIFRCVHLISGIVILLCSLRSFTYRGPLHACTADKVWNQAGGCTFATQPLGWGEGRVVVSEDTQLLPEPV